MPQFNVKIIYCILISLLVLSCSMGSVPNDFEKAVYKLSIKIKKLDEIDSNDKIASLGGNRYEIKSDFRKRELCFHKEKKQWVDIFKELKSIESKFVSTHYHDDILFSEAIGYLKIIFLDHSDEYTDETLRIISDFIALDLKTTIEPWTKKIMNEAIWNYISIAMAKDISEKENLDQFFYLAKANLWLIKKKNKNRALENYHNILKISPNGFWANQARIHINSLAKSE